MRPEDAPGSTDYRALARRMGYGPLRRRLKKQAALWEKETHQGTGLFRLNSFIKVEKVAEAVLNLTGMMGPGRRNFLDLQTVHVEHPLPGLPLPFDGFRILHITDLHSDLYPPLIDVVISAVRKVNYDAVVLTGDYHNQIAESHDVSLDLMARLIHELHGPRIAVLGNHDFVEKVAFLEKAGLLILLNESTPLERNGANIWVAGVDDPHYFRSDDIVRARANIPADSFSLLLSHSPETYREAERMGFSLLLCGHTHGGQFCLPGKIPILRNTRVPRKYLSGVWQYGALRGYTSRGTGGCGVAARFSCPPEITIHTLRQPTTAGTIPSPHTD